VPRKQPKKGRLWLNDGSCLRLRPERANHVWAYDFVEHRTHDGRKFRMLCVVDEFTREALAILVKRRLTSSDVLEVLAELMLARGTPSHIRSDNGPEFAAVAVKEWLGNLGVNTAFIEPGSPWENGYVESFNSKLRDELLDGEIFYSLKEAQILIEGWRRHYNTIRPHSALGWLPPAPEVSITPAAVWRARLRQSRWHPMQPSTNIQTGSVIGGWPPVASGFAGPPTRSAGVERSRSMPSRPKIRFCRYRCADRALRQVSTSGSSPASQPIKEFTPWSFLWVSMCRSRRRTSASSMKVAALSRKLAP
jgi:hypothetical protein